MIAPSFIWCKKRAILPEIMCCILTSKSMGKLTDKIGYENRRSKHKCYFISSANLRKKPYDLKDYIRNDLFSAKNMKRKTGR
jgi:hypothetical protein